MFRVKPNWLNDTFNKRERPLTVISTRQPGRARIRNTSEHFGQQTLPISSPRTARSRGKRRDVLLLPESGKAAAEVVVTCPREKTSRVGGHTDELRQQPHACQSPDLNFHPIKMIEKPPGRTPLDFPRDNSVLETAGNRGKYSVKAGFTL